MKNIYKEPMLEISSFQIRENINNTQDTEDLSVNEWILNDTSSDEENN